MKENPWDDPVFSEIFPDENYRAEIGEIVATSGVVSIKKSTRRSLSIISSSDEIFCTRNYLKNN